MKKHTSSLSLVNKFRNFIIKKNLILPKNELLIAFSGGQDSICLIILIIQLMNQFNLYFGISYCLHLWSITNFYNLSHLLKFSFVIDIKAFFPLAIHKGFTEANARSWRYSVIYRISLFYNYKILMTGHNLTDQTETLLLNLFRGSGKKGVVNMVHDQFLFNKSIKKIFLPLVDLNI